MITFLQLFTGAFVDLASFALLCAFPFTGYLRLPRRKNTLITISLILGSALAYAAAGTYLSFILPFDNRLYQAISAVFICCTILCFFWYLYAVQAIWQKKAFIFLFAMTSALFISSICNCILNFLPGPGSWIPDTPITIAATFVSNVVVIPLLCLFLKYFYLPVEDGMSAKEIGYLSIPLLLLFGTFFIVFSYVDFIYIISNITAVSLYFGLLLTVFLLYGVIFKMYSIAHERYLADEKYARLQYQEEIRREQYKRIYENIENSRKMRHDLRHHMVILQGYLESGDQEKAKDYLNLYLKSMEDHRIIQYCGNPVINMLISHYSDLAKSQDIAFSTHVHIPDMLPVPDTDLSVLVGNLLDNAVSAAATAAGTDRMIRLNMNCSGKMFGVTVDNGFDGDVKQNGRAYLSTKSGGQGLGLKILADIAEKYDGGVEFTHEAVMFHSSVMLRLPSHPARSPLHTDPH